MLDPNLSDFVWARDPILNRMETILSAPNATEKTVEALFGKVIPKDMAILDRKIFVSVVKSLNAGISEQLIDMLAGQLVDRSGTSVDMQRFYKVYHGLVTMSQPVVFSPPRLGDAGQIEQGKQKVLECMAKFMKERRVDSLNDLFAVRMERGAKVLNSSDLEVFLDKSFPEVFFADKEAFLSSFRMAQNPRFISFDSLQTALGQHVAPMGYEELMEEVRLAAMNSFVDVVEVFRQYDASGTGQVSGAEFEFGLKKIRANISSENLGRLFGMVDTARAGRILYLEFARKLEEYSIKRSGVMSGQAIFTVVQQVREALRSAQGSAFHSTLQPYVMSSGIAGKKTISIRDLKTCLDRTGTNLPEHTFTQLVEFLDPMRTSGVDYDRLCEVLGYIQGAAATFQLTSRFPEATGTGGSFGPSAGGERKKTINKVLMDVAKAAGEKRVNLSYKLQDFDFRKEMCLGQPDLTRALSELLPITAPQVSAIAEAYPKAGRPGMVDYGRFCRAAEEATVVDRLLSGVFAAFDRLIKESRVSGLSALLSKWDHYGTRSLSGADLSDILNNMCRTQANAEETEMVVRYYDSKGNGTADLDLLEADYMNARQAPDPGALMRALKEYCEYNRTSIEAALRRQLPISAGDYVSKTELQRLLQEMCKGKVAETAVTYGLRPLTEFRSGEVNLREFVQLYEETNKAMTSTEQGEKAKILDSVAEKAVELGVDLDEVMAKTDSSYERTLGLENMMQLINNYLMLGYEVSSGLASLLGEYDRENSGRIKYDHFLADLKPHIEKKRRVQEYIVGLKSHLKTKGLRLNSVFAAEDFRAKGSLPKDSVMLAIEKTGYIGDRTALKSWLDSFPANYEGELAYPALESKLETEPIAAATMNASTAQRLDFHGKMAADIGRAAEKERTNLAERLADADYARNGLVAVEAFINTLRFLHMPGYSEGDLQSMARKYANPAGDAVQYKQFLADVATSQGKESGLSAVKANLQWANRVLDELAIALHCRKENVTTYFTGYGLNPLNNTLAYAGFAQGIRALKLKISNKETEQLSKDLDVLYDKTVSIQTLNSVIESRQADAVHRYGREISRQLYDCVKSKKIDLAKVMKKYDAYNLKEISTYDFEQELRMIMGANLSDSQYAFLTAKYEKRSGKADYGALIRELESARGLESVTNFYANHPARVVLVDRLRDRIRNKNLRVATMLLGIDKTGTRVFPNKVLYDIFPKDILSNDDYEELVAVLDEKRAGSFHFDSACNLLWTDLDEEEFRAQAASNVDTLYTKVRNFCKNRKVDIEAQFVKADDDGSGYLTSDEIRNVIAEVGMPLSHRQLSALLYYQDLSTDDKWRKSYIELCKKVLGSSTIAQRYPHIGVSSGQTKHVRFAEDTLVEGRAHQKTEETPSFQTLTTGMPRQQRDVLAKISQALVANGINNVRDHFRLADPSELLYLSKNIFFDTFARLRIYLTLEDQQAVLSLPHVADPQELTIIYYEPFVKVLEEFQAAPAPAPRATSQVEPKWEGNGPQVREVKLDEETITYVLTQLAAVKDYLQEKKIDIEREFGRYERDGYIEFGKFSEVLAANGVEPLTQEVADAFYSYLKEEKEGHISLKRLFDSMMAGKRLKQYKSRSISNQESVIKSQIAASGLHFKRLADHIKLHDVSLDVFKTHSTGGRTISKAQLVACFQEIKYECPEAELKILFETIDVKNNGEGSLPHLIKLIQERIVKREERKAAFDEKTRAVIEQINKELEEKNVSLNQFYKALDFNGDGYVDQNEFVNGLISKLGLRITPEPLADLFKALDVDK